MASYKKRADGRYAKQVTVGIKNGKPVKKSVYGKTVKELEKNYRDLMILVDRGVILDNQGMTATELFDEWYRLRKEGKVRRSTELAYVSTKKWIIEAIGEMKVKDVKRYNVECLLNEIQKNGYISKSRTVLTVMRSIFNYAVENDIIAKNPCLGLSVKYEPKEKRILTDIEKDLIDKADLSKKDKAFLYLLRYSGMRRGEIFALHKKDIDGAIHVNKTLIDNRGTPYIQDMTKTYAGDRYIPIFLRLVKPLADYLSTTDDFLFLNRNGNLMSVTSQNMMYQRIIKKVGIGKDLTMHCFRHNFVSECYSAKVDIKKVQSWVGHDDVGTTLNIYTKLSKQEVQDCDIMDTFYTSQKEVKENIEEIKSPLTLAK